jgi:hypothetical protein
MAKESEIRFTSSELDSFDLCRRKYYWQCRRKLETRKRNWAMLGGTTIHACMAAYYENGRDPDAGVAACDVSLKDECKKGFVSVEDQFEVDRYKMICRGIMAAYPIFYKKDKGEVLKVESKFERVRLNGYIFDGTIDLLMLDGGVQVWDHKSKSRIAADMLLALPLQHQTVVYSQVAGLIARKPIKEVVYNFFQRPGIYQGAKEDVGSFMARLEQEIPKNPAKYFMREKIRLTADLVKKCEINITETCKEITRLVEQDRLAGWYRQPISCTQFGRACEYLPLCLNGERDDILIQYTDRKARYVGEE